MCGNTYNRGDSHTRIAPTLADDVSKMFITRTQFSLPKQVYASRSLANEPHPWSRSELNIGDAQGIATPAHGAGNDMTIFEYALHDCHMAQSISALDPGLQHNNCSRRGLRRDAPAKLIGTRHPLPGVGLHFPGNKDSMELEITLIGPPCAGSIGEDISRSRGRTRAIILSNLPGVATHLEDAEELPPVNTVGVGETIVGGQASPTNSIARCYPAQRIATRHNV